ncbi:pyridoxal phosphate-dependent aminotransferase [Streptomyces sp. NPDC005648]|uniref:pyridoxal phosphate-dependent aminotransferase n=1 Tax=Streptomyces sp. NPDC005648 TaxID=3157044 RepID=UPI0033BC75C0
MTTSPPPTIDLGLGDPAHPMPSVVSATLRQMADRPSLGYAPPGGLPALRRTLAEKLTAVNGLDATAREVVVTNGASQGIAAALAELCRPGDRVLVPEPGYPAYRAVCRSLGLTVTGYGVPAGDDTAAQPDWDALARSAAGATAVLWNFPSNPTGRTADPAWYPRLYAVLREHPALTVVSDEVYEDLCFGTRHVSPAARAGDLAARFVSVFSFSKGYAMTGMRVGYVHAPGPDLATRVARRHYAWSMSTPTLSQVCALAVARGARDYPAGHRAALMSGRDRLVAGLRASGLSVATPEAGCFAWADVSASGLDAEAWSRAAAVRLRVLTAPGTEFAPHDTRHVRLSFAVGPAELDAALERVSAWAADGWRPAASARPAEVAR